MGQGFEQTSLQRKIANNHMRRCSTSRAIREMQMKTTVRCTLTTPGQLQSTGLTRDPATPLVGTHPREPRTNAHGSVIHNSQRGEATHVSTSG